MSTTQNTSQASTHLNAPDYDEALQCIQDLAKEFGSMYERYSGRGMLGAQCVGVVTADRCGLQSAALRSGIVSVIDFRSDSLGLDTIVYWPGIQLPKAPASRPSEADRACEYLKNFLHGYCGKGSDETDFLMGGTDWPAQASAELARRRAAFIKALDTFVLEQIAAQAVDLRRIVEEVMQELRTARNPGERHDG